MPFGRGGRVASKKNQGKKSTRVASDKERSGSHRLGNHRPTKQVKMTQREDAGLIPVSLEQIRSYIAGSFIFRYKEPETTDWSEHAKELSIEIGVDTRTIYSVFHMLKETRDFTEATTMADRSGRPTKLKSDNPGLVAAACALNMGVSPNQAVHVCNSVNRNKFEKNENGREEEEPVTISKWTLLRTLRKFTKVFHQRVLRRKTGSRDVESNWAKARLQRCLMTKEMFKMGEALDKGEITWQKIRQVDLLPLYLDGIVFVDQSHVRAVPAGGTGQDASMARHQYRIAVNPKDGRLDPHGVLPERRTQIKPKYNSHSQGCYAICMPAGKPMFLETYNYTGKKMGSVKTGEAAWKVEVVRVKGLRREWRQHNDTANPYLSRYGSAAEQHDLEVSNTSTDPEELYSITQRGWYQKMRQALKTISIKEFLLDLIHKSNTVYKDTTRKDTYMIWHDRLSILWDKETQDWLSSLKCGIEGWPDRTWSDRFIRLRGQYNESISAYYKNSLPGDSPELMPLDCHLFSDIKEGVSRNVAFSFFLSEDDTTKYSLATPKKAFSAIERTIAAGCPSAERIREDIEKIPHTLDRIIASNGAYIEDSERKGVRKEVETESKKNTVDVELMRIFYEKVEAMQAGNGVLFQYNLLTELVDVPVIDNNIEEEEGLDAMVEEGLDVMVEE